MVGPERGMINRTWILHTEQQRRRRRKRTVCNVIDKRNVRVNNNNVIEMTLETRGRDARKDERQEGLLLLLITEPVHANISLRIRKECGSQVG